MKSFLCTLALAMSVVITGCGPGPTIQPIQAANIGKAAVYRPTGPPPSSSKRATGAFTAASLAHAWHPYSTRGTTHFAQAWTRRCGRPVSRERRHGTTWTQRFRHCIMRDTVNIISGRPTPHPAPVQPTPAPVQPTPAPVQPTDTPAPVQQPTQAAPPSNPVTYELYLMNQTRASYGLPPYTLNQTESDGTGSCVGSRGHAQHMASTGVLAHDQFPADICLPVSAAAENIGYGYGSPQQALQQIHSQMMSEPHDAAYCASGSNHACSILSSAYHEAGVGIVTANGTTWLCVDFLG